MPSKFYENLPNPPLSERAIETAALIETRTGDEGELYRRWVAIQIDEARRDAFIECESEMERLRRVLSEIADEDYRGNRSPAAIKAHNTLRPPIVGTARDNTGYQSGRTNA